MSWLLSLSAESGLEDRLFKALAPLDLKSSVEICHSVPDLANLLRQPFLDLRVIVLCIESQEALREILPLGYLLSDRKNILILPDEDKETMAMGFKLRPRFITWVDSDFSELGVILKRMLALYDAPETYRVNNG